MSLVSEMSQNTRERPATGPLMWKSAMDFILACVLIVVTAPVMLLGMLLVYLTSPGPVIYCQTRLGQYGRRYTIYKIRSMNHNCERLTGPTWAKPGDNRVTWIGKILRATHIDELPQLWNILCGEMSLVGPRPERPEIAFQLERALPRFQERLSVRPGVTGLAQVQLPPDVDLNSVRRKLACDLYYIGQITPWLDLRILIGTALGVLGIGFAVTGRVLRIPSGEAVESAYRERSDEPDSLPAGRTEPLAALDGSGEMETMPEQTEPIAWVTSS
jgi:lipopolysaccharide/colanic/teichoic acid biosynthesis glycosyltransferase